MKYKQLTSEVRYAISSYRKTGLSVTQIAKEMNRHRSTIYREIRRYLRQGAYRLLFSSLIRTFGIILAISLFLCNVATGAGELI